MITDIQKCEIRQKLTFKFQYPSKYHPILQANAYRDRTPLFQTMAPCKVHMKLDSNATWTLILDDSHRANCICYNIAGHTTQEHPIFKQLKYQNETIMNHCLNLFTYKCGFDYIKSLNLLI